MQSQQNGLVQNTRLRAHTVTNNSLKFQTFSGVSNDLYNILLRTDTNFMGICMNKVIFTVATVITSGFGYDELVIVLAVKADRL